MPEHLDTCLPGIPAQLGCDAMRELYGRCPDHDPVCDLTCPVANQEG
jgi:hypothetical protein